MSNAHAFAQMRCAFGQSYKQWPNANKIRQMRVHLAKYFQNKTTYARPLLIKRNLNENVYQVVAVNDLKF